MFYKTDETRLPPIKMRLHYAGRLLMGWNGVALRNSVRRDDILLTAYPKSGNHWIEWLVCQMFDPDDPMDWAKLEARVVNLNDVRHLKEPHLRRMPEPRMFRTHCAYDHRYHRVILVVRDPRDIAVSYYHDMVRRQVIDPEHPIPAFVEHFVAGSLDPYGPWGGNVGSWLGARRDTDDFVCLRYEDLLADTVAQVRRLLGLLKLERTDEQLQRVAELSTADRMRSLEHTIPANSSVRAGARKDMSFVRAAKQGTGKTQLPPESIRLIERAWGPLMRELGYETAD